MTKFFVQQAGDTLDWQQDWSDFLGDGDSISSRVWTISPDDSPTLLSSITSASVIVSGLTAGTTYELLETITTANSIVGQRGITLICPEH